MQFLKLFEAYLNELSAETYREVRNKTADWPWTRNAATGWNQDAIRHYVQTGEKPERRKKSGVERAEQMGRINDMAKERFEAEFLREFPLGTRIDVRDSENRDLFRTLEFERLAWRANWTYYELVFTDRESGAKIYFHGDVLPAYALKSDASRIDFQGEIELDGQSQMLLDRMFKFGKRESA